MSGFNMSLSGGYAYPGWAASKAPTPAPASGGGSGMGLAGFGTALTIAGALSSAIGGYYEAKAAKTRLRSEALSLDFQASMANLEARAAEEDAQAILGAGAQEAGSLSLHYSQALGTARAGAAARGVVGGSADEVAASIKLSEQIDAMTLRANTVRAAGNARIRGSNANTTAALARVGASNARNSARAISPLASGVTGLLQGAGPSALSLSRYLER